MDRAAAEHSIVGILSDLIAIPSYHPPCDTRAICAYAADRLRRAGYEVEILSRSTGIDNVVARLGSGTPSLVFNAHADTVSVGDGKGWDMDPLVPVVKDGKVYGLGACNCKGGMAVQLWLAEQVANWGGLGKGEIVFTFVGDEEALGPNGLCFLRESGAIRPDMLIVGAQTGNQLVTEESGVMWVKVTTSGRAAHAGQPDLGDNAVLRMVRLIAALQQDLVPKLAARQNGGPRSTMSVGTVRGGHNINVVPDKCTLEIDRRLLSGERVETAFAELRASLDKAVEPLNSYHVELLVGANGFVAPTDGPCVSAFRGAIEARTGSPARFVRTVGVSDARYFADDGIEMVIFGPGSGSEGHATNESQGIDELVEAALIQLDAVDRLLKPTRSTDKEVGNAGYG